MGGPCVSFLGGIDTDRVNRLVVIKYERRVFPHPSSPPLQLRSRHAPLTRRRRACNDDNVYLLADRWRARQNQHHVITHAAPLC